MLNHSNRIIFTVLNNCSKHIDFSGIQQVREATLVLCHNFELENKNYCDKKYENKKC